MLTGMYKMGDMAVLAGYGQISDLGGNSGDAGQATVMTLGGKMKSGMNTFKLQYTTAESDVSKSDSSIIAVGVDHALTKKTAVYAVYAAISNGDAGSSAFTNSGHDSTVGASTGGATVEDSSGFSLGMIHKF
jgi:predicted porin